MKPNLSHMTPQLCSGVLKSLSQKCSLHKYYFSAAEAPSSAGFLAKFKNLSSVCGSNFLHRQSISNDDPFSGAGSNAGVATQICIEK
jgi:hypothetical protein